jgi:hypothetical protein
MFTYARFTRPVLLALLVLLVTAAAVAPAHAAVPRPLNGAPSSSWQTNGTVWGLAAANGAIYVGGSFTSVRPPGAPEGTGEVQRNYLAAFDAATGELLPFDPNLDAPVKALVASPDGSKVYAGGDFLSVGGVAVGRLAAFDTATGAMITKWKPKAWAGVRALEAYGNTVYVGGLFSTVSNQPRARLAAVDATTGALTMWAPSADRAVFAISAAKDGSKVYVGGMFDKLNGQSRHAIAALDPTTGSALPFPAAVAIPPTTSSCESVVKDLTTDATTVYVANEGSGGGCFDGTFAANASDGSLKWKNACLGATQSIEVVGDYLYKGSHAHNCLSVPGGFGEVEDGQAWHLLAQNLGDGLLGPWYPNTSGNPLGPRVFATDGQRLFVGGDFVTVNNKPQQGFSIFDAGLGVPPIRPDAPAVSSVKPGTVKVSFTATWDRDDHDLVYSLLRDGDTVPVKTWNVSSKPWSLPTITDEDTGLEPGSIHTYRLMVSDGTNSLKSSATEPVTVATQPTSYPLLVKQDLPSFYWRLGEASGSIAADATGNNRVGIYRSGTTKRQAGIPRGEGDTAVRFDGSGGNVYSWFRSTNPQTFSVEAWFKTTTTRGGKLVGYGNRQTGSSNNYDRHIYMTNAGRLVFGVYNGRTETVTSPGSYNDGNWHHVVATLGATGMVLYVDGAPVGANPNTGAENYDGYWRVGGDNLNGWPTRPTSNYFAGTIDEVAVYGTALSAAQVALHGPVG